MNGFTNPSGLYHRPNLCKCGHEYIAHTLGTFPTVPGNCSQCLRQAGQQSNHFFEARMQTYPSTSFLNMNPRQYVNAGGFGFGFVRQTGASGNTKGSTTIQMLNAGQVAGVLPGMTMTSVPANVANQWEYTVLAVQGLNIIIAPPGLMFNSPGTSFIFSGSFGSTMGPGLPPNGQRGG